MAMTSLKAVPRSPRSSGYFAQRSVASRNCSLTRCQLACAGGQESSARRPASPLNSAGLDVTSALPLGSSWSIRPTPFMVVRPLASARVDLLALPHFNLLALLGWSISYLSRRSHRQSLSTRSHSHGELIQLCRLRSTFILLVQAHDQHYFQPFGSRSQGYVGPYMPCVPLNHACQFNQVHRRRHPCEEALIAVQDDRGNHLQASQEQCRARGGNCWIPISTYAGQQDWRKSKELAFGNAFGAQPVPTSPDAAVLLYDLDFRTDRLVRQRP